MIPIMTELKHLIIRANTIVCAMLVLSPLAEADVSLFEGRIEIDGITLLQDTNNPSDYYYVPPYPRLAQNSDGGFIFSFVRYLDGTGNDVSGGVLNAMIELTLPDDDLEELQKALEKQKVGAAIKGPVTLSDPAIDPIEGVARRAGFRLVSASIDTQNSKVMTSGAAPLNPGGRASLAIRLSGDDATLLWNSFQGQASDVAIEIDAAYLAEVEAFNAVVIAEMSAVYNHKSMVKNNQKQFTRDQIRAAVDEMKQDQIFEIKTTDGTKAYNLSSGREEKILDLVTEKLIEIMFDTKTGWAKPIDKEEAVGKNIPGRVKGGKVRMSGAMLPGFGSGSASYRANTDYVPDNQFTRKLISETRVNTFRLDLSRRSLVRMPLQTTGNISGLYNTFEGNNLYFKVISLNDPVNQNRDLTFQLAGDYIPAFGTIFENVTIDVQHSANGGPPRNHTVSLTAPAIAKGNTAFAPIKLQRMGADNNAWDTYKYRTRFTLRGKPGVITVPGDGSWVQSRDPAPLIAPPLKVTPVTLQLDPAVFDERGVSTVQIEVISRFNGEPEILATERFTAQNAAALRDISVFHDPDSPLAHRVIRIPAELNTEQGLQGVEQGYIFVSARDGETQ